jgi:hypothetical protein
MAGPLEAADAYLEAIPWVPQEGPQEEAYFCEADQLLYGGAAGGGKTALAVGLAITRHRETLFIRREATQLGGVLDEVAQTIDPDRKGLSMQPFKEWRIPPWDGVQRKIVFGSTPNLGNESRYQGRARDLLVIDEAANMLKQQVDFLMGWVRSTVEGQRCRTVFCSNPPTTSEGLWLTQMFAPWVDPDHKNPAAPGELRYFTTIAGEDIETGPEPFVHRGETLYPQSRTFIPARVGDNKYLGAAYLATLQAMPEPLRSQMLYGDFTAGTEDDEYQVIPTAWVKLAMKRWKEQPLLNISSVGVDPSRGGRDKTVVAARSGWHFHRLRKYSGQSMETGGDVAAKVVEEFGLHPCPVHVDSIGIGASVIDHLTPLIGGRAIPIVASEGSEERDWSSTLTFANKRAEMWWRMRDLLNPANAQNVALPPDKELLSDLTAPRYKLLKQGIQIESKADIVKRLGRSPDCGDAVVMCAEKSAVMSIKGVVPRHRVEGSLR